MLSNHFQSLLKFYLLFSILLFSLTSLYYQSVAIATDVNRNVNCRFLIVKFLYS